MDNPERPACSRAAVSDFSDGSTPDTIAPSRASASDRIPPPHPTSSARLPPKPPDAGNALHETVVFVGLGETADTRQGITHVRRGRGETRGSRRGFGVHVRE